MLFSLLLFAACKNKCDNDGFAIQQIQPAANKAGYEVFIAASGVSSNTTVRFDEVKAEVKTAEGGLIATVPTGLIGPVTLSIEEGECRDSKSFEIWSTYPSNVPQSPTVIVVPQAPASFPSGISNEWPNIADPKHKLSLQDDINQPGKLASFSKEIYDNGEIPFLDDNPISGVYDIVANTIFIVIDRTAKAGGYRDTLAGQFIAPVPEQPSASATILFVSKRTGRQLVIYHN